MCFFGSELDTLFNINFKSHYDWFKKKHSKFKIIIVTKKETLIFIQHSSPLTIHTFYLKILKNIAGLSKNVGWIANYIFNFLNSLQNIINLKKKQDRDLKTKQQHSNLIDDNIVDIYIKKKKKLH